MSKLNKLLHTVIQKVNASVKTEIQNLTDEEKKQARTNIMAASEDEFEQLSESIDNAKAFYATYDETTFDELQTAYNADKIIMVRDGNYIAPLVTSNGTSLFRFSKIQGSTISVLACNAAGTWSKADYPLLDSSGDTMTGTLTLASDPTENLHATTKQYVDHAINSALGAIAARLAAI